MKTFQFPATGRTMGRMLFLSTFVLSVLVFSTQPSWSRSIERMSPHSQPVSDTLLNQMRGGFAFGGMDFSFGIQSSTFVNGTLMVNTTLQSIGNSLQSSLGMNPFASVSFSNTSYSSSDSNSGKKPPIVITTTQTATNSSSGTNGSYLHLVQVSPSGSGSAGNVVAPTAFSNAAGIVSILQNAASNLVIHNIVNMNATAAHVGAVTHAITLNSMLESSRFLNR
ncbi:MAG: hypothetical protein ACYCYP_12435 [Leptospirales bacterium]